jgi:hypothetical protein
MTDRSYIRSRVRAAAGSPGGVSARRNQRPAKVLKSLDSAKSPASPQLRSSGETLAKRSDCFRPRFVLFRLISSGAALVRRRSQNQMSALPARALQRLGRTRHSSCHHAPLAVDRILV